MSRTEDLTPLFDDYVDAWQRFDEEKLASLFTDDARFTDPYPTEPYIGPAGARTLFARITGAISKLEFQREEPILVADRGLFPFVLLATFRADGVTKRIRAIDLVVTRDGKISELTGYGDFAGATIVA